MSRIQHCKKAMEFYVTLENGAKAMLQYHEKPNRILDFHHTYTPVEAQGKGLAKKLVQEGFKYAAANNYRVDPTCSYVAKYVSDMATDDEKKLSITYKSAI